MTARIQCRSKFGDNYGIFFCGETVHPQNRPQEPDVSERQTDREGTAMETLPTG